MIKNHLIHDFLFGQTYDTESHLECYADFLSWSTIISLVLAESGFCISPLKQNQICDSVILSSSISRLTSECLVKTFTNFVLSNLMIHGVNYTFFLQHPWL